MSRRLNKLRARVNAGSDQPSSSVSENSSYVSTERKEDDSANQLLPADEL